MTVTRIPLPKFTREEVERVYKSLAQARPVGGIAHGEFVHMERGMVPEHRVLYELARNMAPYFLELAERREAVEISDYPCEHNETKHTFRADVIVMHPRLYSDIVRLLRHLVESHDDSTSCKP